MLQRRYDDKSKRRPVKREESNKVKIFRKFLENSNTFQVFNS